MGCENMMFSKIADIHERLRLGADRAEQLSRLKNKDDALLCYELFYPSEAQITHSSVISRLAEQSGIYYDVVKDLLPESVPLWMTLASESSASGSRGYSAKDVLDFPYKAASLLETAHRFNEIEARLVWRFVTKSKPVISKRTFFGTIARLKKLPPYVVKSNMTRDTLIKMYDDPEGVKALEHWYQFPNMFPAPMRWKPWNKLHPPEEHTVAIPIPSNVLVYSCQGSLRNRNGDRIKRVANDNAYTEMAGDVVVDYVNYDSPHLSFIERTKEQNIIKFDLTQHGAWDGTLNCLKEDDVECIRFVNPNQTFKPDGIGGYVMYPHRNRIFLRLNNKLKDNGWELAALDGVDDFLPVCTIIKEDLNMEIDDESCIVVEVIAIRVNSDGEIIEKEFVDIRNDLGISDVIQITELIERGMENDENNKTE